MGWTHFISGYGIWIVAAFIALESVGLPLPAEAALMAAAFFAAKAEGINIHSLITAGIVAAIIGEIMGFWMGRKFGHALLVKHGHRFGLTQERIRNWPMAIRSIQGCIRFRCSFFAIPAKYRGGTGWYELHAKKKFLHGQCVCCRYLGFGLWSCGLFSG
jgi:membrane protein DedA with SNARE-associated domain